MRFVNYTYSLLTISAFLSILAIKSVSHFDPVMYQRDSLSYEYENGSVACVREYKQEIQNP